MAANMILCHNFQTRQYTVHSLSMTGVVIPSVRFLITRILVGKVNLRNICRIICILCLEHQDMVILKNPVYFNSGKIKPGLYITSVYPLLHCSPQLQWQLLEVKNLSETLTITKYWGEEQYNKGNFLPFFFFFLIYFSDQTPQSCVTFLFTCLVKNSISNLLRFPIWQIVHIKGNNKTR